MISIECKDWLIETSQLSFLKINYFYFFAVYSFENIFKLTPTLFIQRNCH